MSDQSEVVIVGADGTEHVFPPGFDPKRAASIVRNGGAPQFPANASAVNASEPDTQSAGQMQGLKNYFGELLTGRGTARNDVWTGIKQEAKGFKNAFNPLQIPQMLTDKKAADQEWADQAQGKTPMSSDYGIGAAQSAATLENLGTVLGGAVLGRVIPEIPRAAAAMKRPVGVLLTKTPTRALGTDLSLVRDPLRSLGENLMRSADADRIAKLGVDPYAPNTSSPTGATDIPSAPGEITPEVANLPSTPSAPTPKPTATVGTPRRGMPSSGRLTYQEAVDAGLPENILKNYPEHAAAAQRDSLLQELSPTPEGIDPRRPSSEFSYTEDLVDRPPLPEPPDPEEGIYKTMMGKFSERPGSGAPATPIANPAAKSATADTLVADRLEDGSVRTARGRPGVTGQDVRDATGPVYLEGQGDSAGLIPLKGVRDIIAEFKKMGSPQEANAYIDAGTSKWTQERTNAIRQVLRAMGYPIALAGAATASTLRDSFNRALAAPDK